MPIFPSDPKLRLLAVSTYVAIVSTIIAVLALLLSVWSAYWTRQSAKETRRYDRLSVEQRAEFDPRLDLALPQVGLFIINSALGPAYIEDMRIYLDGRVVTDYDEIGRLTAPNYKYRAPSWGFSRFYHAVRPGQEWALFYTAPDNIKDVDAYYDLIRNRLFIIVRACSVYENCNDICSAQVLNSQCQDKEASLSGSTAGALANLTKRSRTPGWGRFW